MFGWFGEVGGTRKNHTHRCVSSFYYLAERKVRKTTKIIFRVFNTSNSSPILLFCPRNPKSIFLKIQKDAHRKMDRNPRRKKLIWSHMVPFGVNSDARFRAQKLIIRVRGCVFSYRRDSRAQQKHKSCRKTEKPEIRETLHKNGPGFMFTGFW